MFILCTPLRAFRIHEEISSDHHSAIAGFIIYYLLTFLFCKKFGKEINPKTLLFTIVSAIVIIQLPIRIIDFNNSIVTLSEQIIYLAGCILGFLDYKQYIKGWKSISIGILCYLFFIVFLQPKINHYISFDTITGEIKPTILPNISLINSQEDTISLYSLNNKEYILFDVWNTSCNACIRSFPKIKAYQKEIEKDFPISIYTLNCQKDSVNIFDFLKRRNYNLPTLQVIPRDNDQFMKACDIKYVPTFLIVNKKHELLFKGDFLEAKKFINNLKSNSIRE